MQAWLRSNLPESSPSIEKIFHEMIFIRPMDGRIANQMCVTIQQQSSLTAQCTEQECRTQNMGSLFGTQKSSRKDP